MRMRNLGTGKEGRLETRKIFIPKNATPVHESEKGAVYTYEFTRTHTNGSTGLGALAFWGTAGKPLWHYTFKTTEQRDAKVAEFLGNIEGHAARKAAAAAKKAAWTNPLKPGDVLYTSWGYDQTNVDFYVVTRVSGKRTWVRPVHGELEETGFMSGKTWVKRPIVFSERGEETMHVAQPNGETGAYVKIDESRTAWLDGVNADGTPKKHYTSWYA